MNRLEWSWKARLDIIQIYNYIIEDSLYYSIKTVKEIRELIYKSYRIIYEIKSNEILIRRIWHSSRLLSK